MSNQKLISRISNLISPSATSKWTACFLYDGAFIVNPFQPSVALHIEISCLICSANQMTGFYIKCNTKSK